MVMRYRGRNVRCTHATECIHPRRCRVKGMPCPTWHCVFLGRTGLRGDDHGSLSVHADTVQCQTKDLVLCVTPGVAKRHSYSELAPSARAGRAGEDPPRVHETAAAREASASRVCSVDP
jgi:hypothetical protein